MVVPQRSAVVITDDNASSIERRERGERGCVRERVCVYERVREKKEADVRLPKSKHQLLI